MPVGVIKVSADCGHACHASSKRVLLDSLLCVTAVPCCSFRVALLLYKHSFFVLLLNAKLAILKCHSSVRFRTFTELCSHPRLVPEHFSQPRRGPASRHSATGVPATGHHGPLCLCGLAYSGPFHLCRLACSGHFT